MTRTCSVRAHVRRMPDRIDTPAHRDLCADESVIAALLAKDLERELARFDPANDESFDLTGSLVP